MGRTEYYANRGALITGSALTFRLTRSDMAQPSLGTLSVVKFRELIRLLEEDEWYVASIGQCRQLATEHSERASAPADGR
jgi:hypothetical protein